MSLGGPSGLNLMNLNQNIHIFLSVLLIYIVEKSENKLKVYNTVEAVRAD